MFSEKNGDTSCNTEYCEWKTGQTHNLEDPEPIKLESWDILSMGIEELDNGRDDRATVSIAAEEWYIPTEDTYTMMVSVPFSAEVYNDICISASANAMKEYLSFGYSQCKSWVDQPESYIFHLKFENDFEHAVLNENYEDFYNRDYEDSYNGDYEDSYTNGGSYTGNSYTGNSYTGNSYTGKRPKTKRQSRQKRLQAW